MTNLHLSTNFELLRKGYIISVSELLMRVSRGPKPLSAQALPLDIQPCCGKQGRYISVIVGEFRVYCVSTLVVKADAVLVADAQT